ncbi:hypothetical protein SGLAM104S_05567 [Streptomyces glaucescens]
MSFRTPRASRARLSLFAAGTASLALLTTACGGSGGGASAAPEEFSYLGVTENTTVRTALTTLSKGECKTANDALPLTVETVPQASLDQGEGTTPLTVLCQTRACAVRFAAGRRPALTEVCLLAEPVSTAFRGATSRRAETQGHRHHCRRPAASRPGRGLPRPDGRCTAAPPGEPAVG